jgi:putative transposase
MVEIKASHEESGRTYGAPRVHADLRANGHLISRKRVQRLMREAGLRAAKPKRFVITTDSDHTFATARNIIARDFTATASDRKWACDITYVPTGEDWLYLAVVIDLFSRRVVGHAMASTMTRSLVDEALRTAINRRSPSPGLIHHSDRGSQYASTDYQESLVQAGFLCSMSRKGDCWDNAPVESFFATLKKELVYRTRFKTRAEARAAIFQYIEAFYNVRRRHSTLGYLSPAEFEQRQRTNHKKAA